MTQIDVIGERLLPDPNSIPREHYPGFPFPESDVHPGVEAWLKDSRDYWHRCMGFKPNCPYDPKEFYPPPSAHSGIRLSAPSIHDYGEGIYSLPPEMFDHYGVSPPPDYFERRVSSLPPMCDGWNIGSYYKDSHNQDVLTYEEQRRREERQKSIISSIVPPPDETTTSRYDAKEHKWVQEKGTTVSKEGSCDGGRLPPNWWSDAEQLRKEKSDMQVIKELPHDIEECCPLCKADLQKKMMEEEKKAHRENEKRAEQQEKEWERYKQKQPPSRVDSGYNPRLSVIDALAAFQDRKALKAGHLLVVHPPQRAPDGTLVAPRISMPCDADASLVTTGSGAQQSGQSVKAPPSKGNVPKPKHSSIFLG